MIDLLRLFHPDTLVAPSPLHNPPEVPAPGRLFDGEFRDGNPGVPASGEPTHAPERTAVHIRSGGFSDAPQA